MTVGSRVKRARMRWPLALDVCVHEPPRSKKNTEERMMLCTVDGRTVPDASSSPRGEG